MIRESVFKLVAGIRCFPPAFELVDKYGQVLTSMLDYKGGNRKVEEDHFHVYNDDMWRRTVHVGNPDKNIALKIVTDNFVYENTEPKNLSQSIRTFQTEFTELWELYRTIIPSAKGNRIGVIIEWRCPLEGTLTRLPAFADGGFICPPNAIVSKPLIKYEIRSTDEVAPNSDSAYYNTIVQIGTVHDSKAAKDTDLVLSIDFQHYLSSPDSLEKRSIQLHFDRVLKFLDKNFESLNNSILRS